MIALLTLPRGEGIPWPAPEAWPTDLRLQPAPPSTARDPLGIVIRPGHPTPSR